MKNKGFAMKSEDRLQMFLMNHIQSVTVVSLGFLFIFTVIAIILMQRQVTITKDLPVVSINWQHDQSPPTEPSSIKKSIRFNSIVVQAKGRLHIQSKELRLCDANKVECLSCILNNQSKIDTDLLRLEILPKWTNDQAARLGDLSQFQKGILEAAVIQKSYFDLFLEGASMDELF